MVWIISGFNICTSHMSTRSSVAPAAKRVCLTAWSKASRVQKVLSLLGPVSEIELFGRY